MMTMNHCLRPFLAVPLRLRDHFPLMLWQQTFLPLCIGGKTDAAFENVLEVADFRMILEMRSRLGSNGTWPLTMELAEEEELIRF